MKKIIIPIILIATIVAASWYFMEKKKGENDSNLFSGTVEATEVKLSAEIPGKVLEVTVDEGDTVEKGQLVVRIETAALKTQLEQANAAKMAASGQYSAVNATIKNVKTNLGRSANLLSSGSISEQNYDTVSTQKNVLMGQRQAALGQIKQAQATAEYVQIQIDKGELYSPISGVVLVRSIEPGEMAMPGSGLLTLAQLSDCEVKIYIPETKLGQVKLGQKVKIHSDSYPDKTYTGTVVHLSDQAEFTPKNVQTREERVRLVYAVKVSIPNPDFELKIGMPVDASLEQ